MKIILEGEHLTAIETLVYAIEQVALLDGEDYEHASRDLLKVITTYFDGLLATKRKLDAPNIPIFYPQGGRA